MLRRVTFRVFRHGQTCDLARGADGAAERPTLTGANKWVTLLLGAALWQRWHALAFGFRVRLRMSDLSTARGRLPIRRRLRAER